MIPEPYPELDDIIEMMGEAGRHLADMEGSEGAVGNIRIYLSVKYDLLSSIRYT